MATHFSILAWRIPWTEESDGHPPWGRKESDMTKCLTQTHTITEIYLKHFLIPCGEANIILMVTEYTVFTSTGQIGKNVYKLWTQERN